MLLISWHRWKSMTERRGIFGQRGCSLYSASIRRPWLLCDAVGVAWLFWLFGRHWPCFLGTSPHSGHWRRVCGRVSPETEKCTIPPERA